MVPDFRLRHGPGTPALRGIRFPTSRPHGIMLPIKEVFRDWVIGKRTLDNLEGAGSANNTGQDHGAVRSFAKIASARHGC